MQITQDIPFYRNTSDNTHCFQAGLKMVLKFFLPDKDFSFEELDVVSAKKDGLWTWPMAALIWMQENGFDVIDMEVFDYRRFINEGGSYIIDEFGEEMGKAQIKNSDIEQERKISEIFLEKVDVQAVVPEIEDILHLMKNGYVVTVNVNSNALNEKTGYSGHLIVIKGIGDEGLIINDPGLSGEENKKVTFDIFEKAWAYPNEKAKNITAFKSRV